MENIVYIGMDVHTTSYTLCAYTVAGQQPFAVTQINPSVRDIEKYLLTLDRELGGSCKFICGYEAGCLGYSLYHQLNSRNIECIILAPTTMPQTQKDKLKTDRRDAIKIAKCLAYGTYSPVYVPNEHDDAVKEYIRMRDDGKGQLKQVKQQLIAFCIRHGKHFEGKTYWTQLHMRWLHSLQFDHPILQETFQEYLLRYEQISEKICVYDKRIAELSLSERYADKVKRLSCIKGIATHTALSLIVEVGDFRRFPDAQHFAAFLGLVPGEHSSGTSQHRMGITKAGNTHLRRLLVESAQTYSTGQISVKSPGIRKRQEGNLPEVIHYADRANDRLRRKYLRMCFRTKTNIAKTAVARELACFVWGMMTENIA